jgi:glutathione S-transferase
MTTSTLTLVIGNKTYSSWSLRPWLFLKQMGVEFQEVRIPLYVDNSTALIKANSPSGKVPVLHDGELRVWDSLAICEYVNEKYLNSTGLPADLNTRAVARALCAEMHSGFLALRHEYVMNCRRNVTTVTPSEAAQYDIARIGEIWRDCRQHYGQAGEWLFGEFSMVDAMFAPIAFRFSGYGIPVGEVEQRYINSLLALPAMQEWQHAARQETEVLPQFEK